MQLFTPRTLRRFVFASTMIVVVFSVFAAAFASNVQIIYGVELVPNSGFEGGLSPWGQVWTSELGAGRVLLDHVVFHSGTSSARIEFNGTRDWSFQYSNAKIPIIFGDLFDLQAWVKVSGSGSAELSAITYDTQGNVIDWSFASRFVQGPTDWYLLHSKFVAPSNVAQIEIRLTGNGRATIWVDDVHLIRERNVRDQTTPNVLTVNNSALSLTLDTDLATLTVVDLRTNTIWNQQPVSKDIIVERAVNEQPGVIRTTMFFSQLGLEIEATIKLQENDAEFTVEVSGNGNMTDSLRFPQPFETGKGTYLVVPLNEGISYPVEDTSISPTRLATYAGDGGISMAFWGVTDGDKGQMAIIQTPNDAEIRIDRDQGNLYVAPEWDSQKGQFGYPRSLRYVFFDHGGYVAMCKQYRAYAEAIGFLKTLKQKIQENPNVAMLIGAVDIWSAPPLEESPSDKLAIAGEMKSLGMNRTLWNTLGDVAEAVPASFIQSMNQMGILTSRYDDYQDVMDPANYAFLKSNPPYWWPKDAWPTDVVIGPDGKWVKGWSVTGKDGKQYSCGVLSDQQALKYAVRIVEELKTRPYLARFIDTTTASSWLEDYSPNHSLTRSQSSQWRMQLLQYVSGQTGMVTGSETGIDPAVPYVSYFEGMLSLVPYRPDGPTDQILSTVPDNVAKFQVGYAYRLPLWELVYHDCVVSYWYWNDYNNKIPAIWDKKDLFNILYGTPPMFMLNKDTWNSNKARFLQSYNNVSPVARLVGLSEMTGHQFLTTDRSVQQTSFENGVTITVNFGQSPFNLPDGTTVLPMGFHVSTPSAGTLTVQMAGTLNAAILTNDIPTTMIAGSTYTVHVTVSNTGTTTWSDANSELVCTGDQTFGSMSSHLDVHSLAPGQQYTFTFTLAAPREPSMYNLQFEMIQKTQNIHFGQAVNITVKVTA